MIAIRIQVGDYRMVDIRRLAADNLEWSDEMRFASMWFLIIASDNRFALIHILEVSQLSCTSQLLMVFISYTDTLALIPACTGHAATLKYRFAERANLRAFIQLPALLLTILTHLACFFHALKCPLIISEVNFTKLFTINFLPYGRWARIARNSGNGLGRDVLISSTLLRNRWFCYILIHIWPYPPVEAH